MWDHVAADLDLSVTKRTTFSDSPLTLEGDVEGRRVEVNRFSATEDAPEMMGIRVLFAEPIGPEGLKFKRRRPEKSWTAPARDWLEDHDMWPDERWMATIDWGGSTKLVVRAKESSALRRWLTQERRSALKGLGPSLDHLDRRSLVSRSAGPNVSIDRIGEVVRLAKLLE